MVDMRIELAKAFEVVRRCRYCGNDVTDVVTGVAYAQNPFCNDCLDARSLPYRRTPEQRKVELIGRYFHFSEQEPRKAG